MVKRRKSIEQSSLSNELDTSSLPLASIIRYYDDFSEKTRVVRSSDDSWTVVADGVKVSILWSIFPTDVACCLKKFLAWALARYDPTSVRSFIAAIKANERLTAEWLRKLSCPKTARDSWDGRDTSEFRRNTAYVLRIVAKFMCEMSLFGWSPEDKDFVSGWKWYPQKSESLVNNGQGYYLFPDEELTLISYFDRLSTQPLTCRSFEELRGASVLYLSYQFGIRAIQIAGLKKRDVNTFSTGKDKIVHITFFRAKQREPNLKYPMLKKVKRSWAPIILEFQDRLFSRDVSKSDMLRPDSFFGLTPGQVRDVIRDSSEQILGRPVNPGQFRRVFAQRMADLDMSQLELADAMGHEDIDSCLVYYENSAIHGHIVNRALGLSQVYKKIKDLSEGDYISKDELDALPSDEQVGGAAHGIALAGIGGCMIGQSLCSLSPAISCYTCPKFLPLSDMKTHENVAEELRQVIVQFKNAGGHDNSNPAFAQLTLTMTRLSETIHALQKDFGQDE